MNYKGLIAALAEITTLPLDSEGYGYKYTSLPKILDHVRPILKKHGLGLVQHVFTNDGVPAVETVIFGEDGPVAKSGEVRADPNTIKMANGVQAVGATITYLRRYSITALLGIAGDEDTDAAGKPTKDKGPQKQAATSQSGGSGGGASEKQGKMIYAIGKQLWPDDTRGGLERLAGSLGLPKSSRDMSKKQASQMIEELNRLKESGPDDEFDGGY
jgi:hypothetical protein